MDERYERGGGLTCRTVEVYALASLRVIFISRISFPHKNGRLYGSGVHCILISF